MSLWDDFPFPEELPEPLYRQAARIAAAKEAEVIMDRVIARQVEMGLDQFDHYLANWAHFRAFEEGEELEPRTELLRDCHSPAVWAAAEAVAA